MPSVSRHSALLVILLGSAAMACAGTEGLKRKRGKKYQAETDSWLEVIRERGASGMWLVSRGYHAGDDMVAIATNSKLSHASVLDMEKLQVVEAVGKGVVVTPLEKFLKDTHRVLLIRPKNWTAELGRRAVVAARSRVGAGYDYFGIIGLPSSKHFYCSELALWSVGMTVGRKGPQNVVHPRKMHKLGKVLFDSGPRDGKPDGEPGTTP